MRVWFRFDRLFPSRFWVWGACLGVLGGLWGCHPKTAPSEGDAPDLSQLVRDLGSCVSEAANLIRNPGFEAPSTELDGNGKANNTGNPASSIPNWDGCCSQAGGGTTWVIATTSPKCGTRALSVQSTSANANVLNQSLPLSSQVGKTLLASAFVFVQSVSGAGQLGIDVWDDQAKKVIASSVPVNNTTPDWFKVDLSVPIPAGGNLQLRITSSGTLTALVDDPIAQVR